MKVAANKIKDSDIGSSLYWDDHNEKLYQNKSLVPPANYTGMTSKKILESLWYKNLMAIPDYLKNGDFDIFNTNKTSTCNDIVGRTSDFLYECNILTQKYNIYVNMTIDQEEANLEQSKTLN